MKKLFYLFLFSLLVTLFAGCSKEAIKEPQTKPEEFGAQLKSSTRAVLYINNFNKTAENFPKILGNAIQEDSLLNWCKVQGFTELNLYSIGSSLLADSAQKRS